MMLPSYVDVLPSGRERGDCYAIDLGGTNLRVGGGWVGGLRHVVPALPSLSLLVTIMTNALHHSATCSDAVCALQSGAMPPTGFCFCTHCRWRTWHWARRTARWKKPTSGAQLLLADRMAGCFCFLSRQHPDRLVADSLSLTPCACPPGPPLCSNWEVPQEHFDLDSGGLIAFVAKCTAEVVRQHSGGGSSSSSERRLMVLVVVVVLVWKMKGLAGKARLLWATSQQLVVIHCLRNCCAAV